MSTQLKHLAFLIANTIPFKIKADVSYTIRFYQIKAKQI